MKPGKPVEPRCPRPGPWNHCCCGKCNECGFDKHTAVHMAPLDHEGQDVVWGHEFVPLKQSTP